MATPRTRCPRILRIAARPSGSAGASLRRCERSRKSWIPQAGYPIHGYHQLYQVSNPQPAERLSPRTLRELGSYFSPPVSRSHPGRAHASAGLLLENGLGLVVDQYPNRVYSERRSERNIEQLEDRYDKQQYSRPRSTFPETKAAYDLGH